MAGFIVYYTCFETEGLHKLSCKVLSEQHLLRVGLHAFATAMSSATALQQYGPV